MGLMPYVRPKYLDDASVLAIGYQLYFYAAGSTTKQDTFTDSSLATPNPNPIILNARGEPDNAGTPIDVYFTPGLAYKVVLATDTDTDPPTSPVWSVDNVTDTGGGGGGSSTGQYLSSTPAVYINSVSFYLAGIDVTADFHPGRRVWLGGVSDRYGVIQSSSFGPNTSVVVGGITDAAGSPQVLDPAMDKASLSIQTVTGDRAIHYRFYPGTDANVTNYEFPIGDLRRYGALMDDVDDSIAFINCVNALPIGASLFIPDGIAVIRNMTFTKTVHIFGKGTLKQLASWNSSVFFTFNPGMDGSTIKDITIDANKAAQTTEATCLEIRSLDVTVTGAHIHNGLIGIQIPSVDGNNAQILNNRVDNCGWGIRSLDASDVTISGNSVTNYETGGIEVVGLTVVPNDILIANNYVTNKASAFVGGFGILIQSSFLVSVVSNIIDRCKAIALEIRKAIALTAPGGFVIQGNLIIEPVDTGIHLGECDQTIVSGNVVYSNGVSTWGIRPFGTGSGGITSTLVEGNVVGQVTAISISNEGGAVIGENVQNSGTERQSSLSLGGNALTKVGGISQSNIETTNFHGTLNWPANSATSDLFVFTTPEIDLNYEIIEVMPLSPGYRQAHSYWYVTQKTVNGFAIQGDSVVGGVGVFSFIIIRTTTAVAPP
ncbi:MAG: right-handed parallel beta-helix repeat-containing protein [Thiohalomonadales bacterium]